MTELKTKVTSKSVPAFLKMLESDTKRKDAEVLVKIFKEVTGEQPKLWGENIIGFGQYHYESTRSSQKGDWPLTAFSPQKQKISIYIMPGFTAYGDIMAKLGKYKTGTSCLYINKLDDIDVTLLKKLIKQSVVDMKKKYG
jgi:hypothetical protein